MSRRIAVEISGDGLEGGARIIGGALSKTGRPGLAVFGDPDSENGSFGYLEARYGPLLMELGQLPDGGYGLMVYDKNGNVQAIMDQDGLRVYHGPTQELKARIGDLGDDDYGVAAVDPLGRMVKLDTISFGQKAAYDTSSDSTTSTSYVGLGGPSVTDVLIGPTRRCKVTIGCQMDYAITGNVGGGGMSVEIAGATAKAADDDYGLVDSLAFSVIPSFDLARIFRASYTHFFDDLNPGLHSFTAMYKSTHGQNTDFADRTLIVEPF